MDIDTTSGRARRAFPLTRASLLGGLASEQAAVRERAFGGLVAAYWKPVYWCVRLKWGATAEDAQDLTQEFFLRALEKRYFDRYDPARARFRTFLRTCLDGFVANERKAAGRQKRGGGAELLPLDFSGVEAQFALEAAGVNDVEACFHREWVRSLFELAVEQLEALCHSAGKETQLSLFRRYDLEGSDAPERPSYQELAAEFGLPVTQVTNHLAWARREFRRLALETLEAMTGSEAEFRQEARALFGVDPG